MKAAFISAHGGPEVLQIGEVKTPEPAAREVRVKVHYSSINHLDLWVRKGLPGLKLTYPHVLGGDASGTVDKVGAEVSRFKPGDEVIVHPGLHVAGSAQSFQGWESRAKGYRILGEHVSGTNAEYVVVPEENIFAKPEALSFEQAAAIGLVFTTAWQMVVRLAQVEPGDSVLVHAAGSGVGSAAIQIAKLMGARVVATASTDKKRKLACQLGAEAAGTYEDVPELSKGMGGFDSIIDSVGVATWENNIRSVKSGGRIVLCGATSGYEAKTDLRHVFFRQIQILGSTMGSKGDFPKILDLFSRGSLAPVIDKSFALESIKDAHSYIEGRSQFGKVLVSL